MRFRVSPPPLEDEEYNPQACYVALADRASNERGHVTRLTLIITPLPTEKYSQRSKERSTQFEGNLHNLHNSQMDYKPMTS